MEDNNMKGIMNLLARLETENSELSQKVKMLEEENLKLKSLQESNEGTLKSITRVGARTRLIKKIKVEISSKKVRVATREEGSGIVIGDENVKFYFAKINEKNKVSWSAITDTDLESYNYFIFSILDENEMYNLVFSKVEIEKFVAHEDTRHHINFSIEQSDKLKIYMITKNLKEEVTNNVDKFDYFL